MLERKKEDGKVVPQQTAATTNVLIEIRKAKNDVHSHTEQFHPVQTEQAELFGGCN